MISQLRGTLRSVNDQMALVEANGLGYEIMVPTGLAERLRDNNSIGNPIKFETIYYIEAGDRKSAHYPRLVGFTDPIDKEFFSLFIQVPGLGVKKALKSLVLPIRDIAVAIETKDASKLNRLPGVGARLAEKIIAELHGKTTKFALSKVDEPLAATGKKEKKPFVSEAIDVLAQLQYTRQEAEQMIEKAVKDHPDCEAADQLITLIFQSEQQRREIAR